MSQKKKINNISSNNFVCLENSSLLFENKSIDIKAYTM